LCIPFALAAETPPANVARPAVAASTRDVLDIYVFLLESGFLSAKAERVGTPRSAKLGGRRTDSLEAKGLFQLEHDFYRMPKAQ
jgi:hypothetical protein